MKIGVDLRALTAGEPATGVAVYLTQLLPRLLAADSANEYFLWWNGRGPLPDLHALRAPNATLVRTHVPNRLLNLQLGLGYRPLDRLILTAAGRPAEQLDWLWLPDPRPVVVSATCRLAVTLHDLSPLRFPQFFSRWTRLWHRFLRLPALLGRADRVLTVSQFAAAEAAELLALPAAKMSVTPLAAGQLSRETDPAVLAAVRTKYGLPAKFFLHLGTLEPRKNLRMLVRAFAGMRAITGAPHALVLAGQRSPIFAAPGLPRRRPAWLHLPGHIAAADKAALLSAATAVVLPSVYEGFGLPAVEALAVGTPLLAADIPALREVADGAAAYAPPTRPDAWQNLLARAATDSEFMATLAHRGPARARQFGWEKTARLTRAVWQTTSN